MTNFILLIIDVLLSFLQKVSGIYDDFLHCWSGKDALVKAKTGTGKTTAFLVHHMPLY